MSAEPSTLPAGLSPRIARTRNIGISAHIDSGKTTLTERILFYAGKIHRIVEVKDKSGGGATMDFMELERERGITIQSAATHLEWKDFFINVIDTPGHVDFTVEVERALAVLDGAILVLCGVAGVQSQSITVDRQMRRYNVPRIAFINKLDRAGADPYKVTEALRSKLHHNAVMVNIPIGLEDRHAGVVDLLTRQAIYFEGDNGENLRYEACPADMVERCEEYRFKLIEALSDFDDALMEKFLEGDVKDVPAEQLVPIIRRATIALKLTPVFCGSAFKNKGVQILLDGVLAYLPNPAEVKNEAFLLDKGTEEKVQLQPIDDLPTCALAFKLEDGRYGQLTYLRLYQGRLTRSQSVQNVRTGQKVKIGRLVRMSADKMEEIEEAGAGDIVALFGVDCAAGDTFSATDVRYSLRSMFVPEPVINYAVQVKDKTKLANFSKALNRFAKEDPTFRVRKDEESGETIIAGMGELHLEVYVERMKREYGVETVVGEPQVAYRETVSQAVDFEYTHKKQTGGSGQYAKIAGRLTPIQDPAPGEHYRFADEVVGGSIPREYISSCDKGFRDSMEKGVVIGFPVTDIEVKLLDGAAHAVDSSDMAFQICARAALKEALRKAKPIVLEPIMKVAAETPEQFVGAVQTSLIRRRGNILGTETSMGITVLEAHVPLAEMFGYSTELRSVTQGQAAYTMEFQAYAQVPRQLQEELVKKYAGKDKDKD